MSVFIVCFDKVYIYTFLFQLYLTLSTQKNILSQLLGKLII